jgi:hypothetical protein
MTSTHSVNWCDRMTVWRPAQVRADFVVHGLRPAVVTVLLAAFTVP